MLCVLLAPQLLKGTPIASAQPTASCIRCYAISFRLKLVML